ncbi:MAG: penicillin acylase family protein [Chloroflexi bacterium]|nr:penicillin acylase family protein [Chloroflexota bacterium]MBU1746429.1 penicillin acylase family protein [Chloroflexota bacterium]MBU1877805.1 penicillin acylase family protein [Chloroflexota bacterium]
MRQKLILLLITALLLLALLVGSVGAGGYWMLFQRPLPETAGTLKVPGLTGRVEVIRDKWGIPHIYAESAADLFFAQGYVTAGDRLAQMEVQRRLGSGRLAEVAGESVLETDRLMRTLGLRRVAEAEWAALQKDPATHDSPYQDAAPIMLAYAAGVNAYIDTHRDRLPLELTLLGVSPEPWTPVDTLVWGKVMALGQCANLDYELARLAISERLGQGKTQELVPGYPADAPLIIPDNVSETPPFTAQASVRDGLQSVASLDYGPARTRAEIAGPELLAYLQRIRAAAGLGGPGTGSNNWVIDGTRSASGRPLLANDPHMGIQMPALWYLVHLEGAGFDVIGASLPGVPGVVLGHNQRIAWGATNSIADVQDLYVEHLSPGEPLQYEYRGGWYDVRVITETIGVRNAPAQTLHVRYTRHGPIVSDVLPGQSADLPLALRWTALDISPMMPALLALNRAATWTDFRDALRQWAAPSLNMVYADVYGEIGYQLPGRIPVRAHGQGDVPAAGWTGEYEWEGYIPFDQLPSRYNPPEGYIVTANNRIVGDGYPYHLASEYDMGNRAQRITDLLTERKGLTARDLQAIQGDVLSLSADRIVPYLLRVTPQNVTEQEVLAHLENWDRLVTADSPGACVFEVWRWHILRDTFGDELGDLLDLYMGTPQAVTLLESLLATPDSEWFDDTRTAARETWPDIARLSLEHAIDELEARLGPDTTNWAWGRLHTATFESEAAIHPLLALVLNRGPYPRPGDVLTVNVGSYNGQYQQRQLPAYRQVVDMANWRESWMVLTVGQSAHPASPHYDDLLPLWLDGHYAPMLFEREDVVANAEATLVLTPAP